MLVELLNYIKHTVELRLTRRAFKNVRDDAAALDAIERYIFVYNGGDARKARRFVEHVAALREECQLLDERDRLRAELKALRQTKTIDCGTF